MSFFHPLVCSSMQTVNSLRPPCPWLHATSSLLALSLSMLRPVCDVPITRAIHEIRLFPSIICHFPVLQFPTASLPFTHSLVRISSMRRSLSFFPLLLHIL